MCRVIRIAYDDHRVTSVRVRFYGVISFTFCRSEYVTELKWVIDSSIIMVRTFVSISTELKTTNVTSTE